MGADCKDDGRVALLGELIEGDVSTEPGVGFDFYAGLFYPIDFCADGVARQAVFGYAGNQESAGFGEGFEYGDVVALKNELVCSGDSGGSGTNDGDLLIGASAAFWGLGSLFFGQFEFFIGQETFQAADADGLVVLGALASLLARMMADSAEDAGENNLFAD